MVEEASGIMNAYLMNLSLGAGKETNKVILVFVSGFPSATLNEIRRVACAVRAVVVLFEVPLFFSFCTWVVSCWYFPFVVTRSSIEFSFFFFAEFRQYRKSRSFLLFF